jgi:DNA-binding PadR family transcriptional regulator
MTIPHALLALLATQPKIGLRLKEEFEARTGSVWPLNVGQVYTTLQRLERDGQVESPGHHEASASQRLYALTPAGRTELVAWFHTAPDAASPPRDEVVIKIMVALTVADFDVFEIIQTHRRRVLEAMQLFSRLKRDDGADMNLALVADAELFRLEATTRWLDSCEARLRSGEQLAATTQSKPMKSLPPSISSTSSSTPPAAKRLTRTRAR